MLLHVHDATNIEAQELEFPDGLVLRLDVDALGLHDHSPWLEWAPDAVEGQSRIYDLGRHLVAGNDVCVKVGGVVVVEFVLRHDKAGWHITLSGPGGERDVSLPDFEPASTTGLGISRRGTN